MAPCCQGRLTLGEPGKVLRPPRKGSMMTNPFACLTLALGLAAFIPTPGYSQAISNCAERESVVEKLQSSYGETRQSIGLGANNSLVEVFASDETGTWTITVTMPGGKTCLVASGQAFEELDEKVALGNAA